MGMYKDVMGILVRVLAVDNIDNSTKQSWQKLIDADLRQGGNGSALSLRDKFDYDCCPHALLQRQLEPAQWYVLVAKYSTHNANEVAAIGRLVSRISPPAPQLFIYKALTAWAIPKLKGCEALHGHDRPARWVLRHEYMGCRRLPGAYPPQLERRHPQAP